MYFERRRFWKQMACCILAVVLAGAAAVFAVFITRGYGAAAPPADGGRGWAALAVETRLPEPGHTPETPGYQALFPELYAAGAARSTLYEERTVYLTFDDGPSERTPEVLAILADYGIKATFFVDGREDEQSRQWMREIAEAGHTLGMHSYSHGYERIYASVEDFLADLNKLSGLIYEAAGQRPQLLRFPGGSVNAYSAGIYQELIAEVTRRGFAYFDWNVSAEDASPGRPEAEAIVENVVTGAADLRRAVVLLHDSAGRTETVEALPAIIEGCRGLGLTFEALTPEVVPVVFGYSG